MNYEIILPSKPKIVSEEGNKGVYEIDGLYTGYGYTIGNALRRVLLSSLPGAAATSVKIEGVSHEFSTIAGVKEDAIMIILNLKQIRFKMHGDEPQKITLSVKGPKNVTAKDLTVPSQVEVLNEDAPIATLTSKDSKLKLELTVEKGLGYVPREVLQKEKVEVGTMILDAIFTPIRRVNYETENMRVGDRTDYNRLRFVIETDGSISPKEALEEAIKITIKQLKAMVGFKEDEEIYPEPLAAESERKTAPKEKKDEESAAFLKEDATSEMEVLKTRIEDLKLPPRILTSLSEVGIRTVGGLVKKKESDLWEIEGIGKKAIDQIKEALKDLGVTLK